MNRLVVSTLVIASMSAFGTGVAHADDTTSASASASATASGTEHKIAEQQEENAEERTAHNSIFLELLGNGGLYSINYERMFGDSNASLRVGFSYFSVSANDNTGDSARATLITVPILANYYVGGQNHKLQLGAGVLIADLSASSGSTGTGYLSGNGVALAGTAVVGYRYIPAHGGFNFGVGFTPLLGAGGFEGWGGISFGAGF